MKGELVSLALMVMAFDRDGPNHPGIIDYMELPAIEAGVSVCYDMAKEKQEQFRRENPALARDYAITVECIESRR